MKWATVKRGISLAYERFYCFIAGHWWINVGRPLIVADGRPYRLGGRQNQKCLCCEAKRTIWLPIEELDLGRR